MISLSQDNVVQIWDLENNILRYSFAGFINTILVYKDFLFGAATFNRIILSNYVKNRKVCVLSGHTDEIITLFLIENNTLASASRAGEIFFWDLDTCTFKTSLIGHSDSVNALACNSNGILASGGLDLEIKIWNISSGELLFNLTDDSFNCTRSLLFLPNGYLISLSFDGKIGIWDVDMGRLKRKLSNRYHMLFTFIYLSPDGDLVSGSTDNLLSVWDVENGSLKANFILSDIAESSLISSVVVIPNKYLITGSWDHAIIFWPLNNTTINSEYTTDYIKPYG